MTDLNNVTDTGLYSYDKLSSAMTNAPSTGTYFSGTLRVTYYQSGKILQEFINDEGRSFSRHKWNGTWIAWQELALDSNKANYEYGTWTPNIERMTITSVTARYVKIGSIYICSAKFAITALGTGNPYINGTSVPGYASATHNSIEGNWSSSADTFGQVGHANNNNIWFAKNGVSYGMTNEVGKDVHLSFIVFPT